MKRVVRFDSKILPQPRLAVKQSLTKSIFTDVQFWVPVAVLILGIALLVVLS